MYISGLSIQQTSMNVRTAKHINMYSLVYIDFVVFSNDKIKLIYDNAQSPLIYF